MLVVQVFVLVPLTLYGSTFFRVRTMRREKVILLPWAISFRCRSNLVPMRGAHENGSKRCACVPAGESTPILLFLHTFLSKTYLSFFVRRQRERGRGSRIED